MQGVSYVINFDVPNTPDAYTHRVGRTGRAEREGRALTFVTRDDTAWLRATERKLGNPIPRRTVEGFEAERLDTGDRHGPSRRAGGRGEPRPHDPATPRGRRDTDAVGAARRGYGDVNVDRDATRRPVPGIAVTLRATGGCARILRRSSSTMGYPSPPSLSLPALRQTLSPDPPHFHHGLLAESLHHGLLELAHIRPAAGHVCQPLYT